MSTPAPALAPPDAGVQRRRETDALAGGASRQTRTSTASATSSSEHSATGRAGNPAASCANRSGLTNDARLNMPSTVICTGYSVQGVQGRRRGGLSDFSSWVFGDLRRSSNWIDLPTSHWVMWSRPREFAEISATSRRPELATPEDEDPSSAKRRVCAGWLELCQGGLERRASGCRESQPLLVDDDQVRFA